MSLLIAAFKSLIIGTGTGSDYVQPVVTTNNMVDVDGNNMVDVDGSNMVEV